jgi:Putative metallopeptidase
MPKRLLCLAFVFLSLATPAGAAKPGLPKALKGLTKDQIEETTQFAVGNASFFIFHEAGHMLVSEFELPVLGREEDAADALASILMLEAEDEDFDNAMMDSANGWFMSASASYDAGDEPAYWDSHALDEQRAYNMVCMMLGKDPKKFKEFADSIELPQERADECSYEYEAISDSWYTLLEPHEVTGKRKTKFKIDYQKPKSKALTYYANMARNEMLLEMIEETFSGVYAVKDGIRLTAMECGEENAYWSPEDRELTFCYELLKYYAGLNADYIRENPEEN